MKKFIVGLIFIMLGTVFSGCVKNCTCMEITDIVHFLDTVNIEHQRDTVIVTENTRNSCKSLNNSTFDSIDNGVVQVATTLTCK